MNYQEFDLLSEFRIGIQLKNPAENKIKYVTSDGKVFYDELQAYLHDREVSRERYYQQMLKDRNWFQKLFNIKPSMKFYDEMASKTNP
jgi:hypothetical protein